MYVEGRHAYCSALVPRDRLEGGGVRAAAPSADRSV
jgi:hypothetical protein